LLKFAPKGYPQFQQVGIDGRVLGLALLVSVLTALLFGLVPALRLSRPDLIESLKEASRGSSGNLARNRLDNSLIVAEVALSLMLLTGAGLLIKSFWLILTVDPGYRTENRLAMEIESPPLKYPEPQQRLAFYQRVLERIEALPGVCSAALINCLPLRGGQSLSFTFEGRPPSIYCEAEFQSISTDYLSTMEIPLLRGRPFTRQDDSRALLVALITLLLSLFSLIGLLLAAVGIYGVVSYSVSRRTHEVGIRMALGARTGNVLKLMVRQGMILALIGTAIGLLGALALTRLLSSLLFGVSTTDPATFLMVSLLLAGVAMSACYIPARRATKVDPMVALRYE
jgi:hypothetical protein